MPGWHVAGWYQEWEIWRMKVKVDQSERTATACGEAYMVSTGNTHTQIHIWMHLFCVNICINSNRILIERNAVNSSTKACSNEGHCFNHEGYLDHHLPLAQATI